MTKLLKRNTLYFLGFIVFFTNCESAEKEADNSNNDTENVDDNLPENQNLDITIGGSIFSIPSPIQTAMYIKDAGAEFDAEALNSFDNAENYSTDFLKAFNLGIYGTDLGYAAIYENNDLSIRYLKTVREMAEYIGLENAFNDGLIERFSNNMGVKDSMMVLVSEAYKETDLYLKENNKDDVAALVLAGGWIEAMYIACRSVKDDNNQQIANRIAEQKTALESLITMLGQLATSDDYLDLTAELEELYSIFDEIEYAYEYVPSVTDASTKTTIIKSKREITKTDDLINNIISKLMEIRNEYTQ
jgi:hypothetical protein